MTVNVGMQS